MKYGLTYKCIRFSEWLELMRKNVECTFGIMKGRFCILRYGIRSKSIEIFDEIWKTCCALHNMLLSIDGLHKDWDKVHLPTGKKVMKNTKRKHWEI